MILISQKHMNSVDLSPFETSLLRAVPTFNKNPAPVNTTVPSCFNTLSGKPEKIEFLFERTFIEGCRKKTLVHDEALYGEKAEGRYRTVLTEQENTVSQLNANLRVMILIRLLFTDFCEFCFSIPFMHVCMLFIYTILNFFN